MNLLLDTHALLWWIDGGDRIAPAARDAIADPEATVGVSAASAWEVAIKRASGKLDAPPRLGHEIQVHGFTPLIIAVEHAERAGGLPRHHADPFDRMLIAQAQVEGLVLVTRDGAFAPYDVRTLVC